MALINRINYFLTALGFAIVLIEALANYINGRVFLHSLFALGLLAIVNIITSLHQHIKKVLVKLCICIFILFADYTYLTFLYTIDITILVVPENFKGNLTVLFGNKLSRNKIKPCNKILLIATNEKGEFVTSSKYELPLNTIIVAEEKRNKLDYSKKLILNNSSFINLDTLSMNVYKLSGNITQIR
ncbi:hypothetical protein [Mucilaginibacter sp.]